MTEPLVLVINCGSSSVRYQLRAGGRVRRGGIIDGIGTADIHWQATDGTELPAAAIGAHHRALEAVFDHLAASEPAPAAIGHRVVHGGAEFSAAVPVDDGVRARIARLSVLAPGHNLHNLRGIEVAAAHYPGIPQVAVFDTAFHQRLPERAYRYALPADALAGIAGIGEPRRYGFHGISHGAALHRAANWLQRPAAALDLVTLHLGNGASAAAIRGGHSIDTSMGLTPLEGLVMGTRCGDLDPALPLLLQAGGRTPEQIRELLETGSGLKALCGSSDMRTIRARAAAGERDAQLARELFAYRVKKVIGAYLAVLGRADALVFTGGIGAHDVELRRQCVAGLEGFGIVMGDARFEPDTGINALHDPQRSPVAVLAMAADEEAEIARQVVACLGANLSGSGAHEH